jgi:hypothetical protein
LPVKTKAVGGRKGRGKAEKSIRQIAREVGGRAPATILRWLDRGMPREGKARAKWIADNTIPEAELKARRSGGQRSGSWAAKAAEECRLLRARIRLAQHALEVRVAKLVKRSTARAEVRRRTAVAVAVFADVPSLVAALVDGEDRQAMLRERAGVQVANALRCLKRADGK